MDQKKPSEINLIDMQPESELERLEREHLDTLLKIERRLDDISQRVDRNTRMISLLLEALPPIPVDPIKLSDLTYNHETRALWADERYYINFDGKQAELIGRLFTKSGMPKTKHLSIDELVQESYDYAKDESVKAKTFYLRGREIQKKIDDNFRTKNLLVVTLGEIYFHKDNRGAKS